MVDGELVEELDAASRRLGIARMPFEAADAYVRGLAEKYIVDPSSLYWWESLKCAMVRIPYGNADGLAKLTGLVDQRSDASLIVTDDERPPWPVYSGDAGKIISMLKDCRFFEYILAANDMSWIVFDTHMNELIGIGLN